MIINANVILAKCRTDKELYGMRVEECGKDWIRTWAFKIREDMARHEGFDKVFISGSFAMTDEYPGCPYCGGNRFIVCGVCKKISCYNGEDISVCRWCGNKSTVVKRDRLNVKGGDF